jgi:hypothetical protein
MNAVTFTEREAIKKMMDYIEREKERLSNQYIGLLDRLRELDELEKPLQKVIGGGLPEGKADTLSSTEIKDKHYNGSPFLADYSHVRPCNLSELSLDEAIKVHNEMYAREEELDHEEELIPKTEIEALKDKDEKNKPVKTSSQRDVKVVAQFIKAILKEAGIPLKTSELIKRLDEAGINTSSPYVLLQQASQYDPKIQKPKFGFYQYNFSA